MSIEETQPKKPLCQALGTTVSAKECGAGKARLFHRQNPKKILHFVTQAALKIMEFCKNFKKVQKSTRTYAIMVAWKLRDKRSRYWFRFFVWRVCFGYTEKTNFRVETGRV